MGADIFNITGRLAAAINKTARDNRNFVPIGIIVALLGLLALRALFDELRYEMGSETWSMFATPIDRFGDLLKSAASYLPVEQFTRQNFANWPVHYNLTYIKDLPWPIRHNLHLLPVASLLLLTGSKLVLAFGGTQTLLIFTLVYLGCTALICRFLAKSMSLTRLDAFAFGFVLLFSYPALFMLTRGNFNAGFTTLLVCAYALSVASGKARWLGWAAFALAIDMRPNVAILVMIEFIATAEIRRLILRILAPAVLSIVFLALAFVMVNKVYPIYTIANVHHGLGIYNNLYFLAGAGADWNMSLYMAGRYIFSRLGLLPRFLAVENYLVMLCGGVIILTTLWLLLRQRLTKIETVFMALAIGAMFTPVFALYHMAEFAAALPLILQENRKNGIILGQNTWLILAVSLLVMSPLGGSNSDGLFCALLLLFSTAFILYRRCRQAISIASA